MMVKDFERDSERYGRRWNQPQEDRHCLKCRRHFKSWGKQNRLCENCKRHRPSVFAEPTGMLPK